MARSFRIFFAYDGDDGCDDDDEDDDDDDENKARRLIWYGMVRVCVARTSGRGAMRHTAEAVWVINDTTTVHSVRSLRLLAHACCYCNGPLTISDRMRSK